eukprot:g7985.t1
MVAAETVQPDIVAGPADTTQTSDNALERTKDSKVLNSAPEASSAQAGNQNADEKALAEEVDAFCSPAAEASANPNASASASKESYITADEPSSGLKQEHAAVVPAVQHIKSTAEEKQEDASNSKSRSTTKSGSGEGPSGGNEVTVLLGVEHQNNEEKAVGQPAPVEQPSAPAVTAVGEHVGQAAPAEEAIEHALTAQEPLAPEVGAAEKPVEEMGAAEASPERIAAAHERTESVGVAAAVVPAAQEDAAAQEPIDPILAQDALAREPTDAFAQDALEEPAVQIAAVEEPVVGSAVAEEAIEESTAAEEPFLQISAAQEPVVESAAAEEPVVESAAAEEAIEESTAAAEPAMQIAAAEEPIEQATAAEEPVEQAAQAEVEPPEEVAAADGVIDQVKGVPEPEKIVAEESALEKQTHGQKNDAILLEEELLVPCNVEDSAARPESNAYFPPIPFQASSSLIVQLDESPANSLFVQPSRSAAEDHGGAPAQARCRIEAAALALGEVGGAEQEQLEQRPTAESGGEDIDDAALLSSEKNLKAEQTSEAGEEQLHPVGGKTAAEPALRNDAETSIPNAKAVPEAEAVGDVQLVDAKVDENVVQSAKSLRKVADCSAESVLPAKRRRKLTESERLAAGGYAFAPMQTRRSGTTHHHRRPPRAAAVAAGNALGGCTNANAPGLLGGFPGLMQEMSRQPATSSRAGASGTSALSNAAAHGQLQRGLLPQGGLPAGGAPPAAKASAVSKQKSPHPEPHDSESSRTLKLTLKWEPFWLILTNQKRFEYRDVSTFIEQRLFKNQKFVAQTDENSREYEELKREYDFVEFRNGRGKASPIITLPFEGFARKTLAAPFRYANTEHTGASMNSKRASSGVELPAGDYYVIKLGEQIVSEENIGSDFSRVHPQTRQPFPRQHEP